MLNFYLQQRLNMLKNNVIKIKSHLDMYPQDNLKVFKANGKFYYNISSKEPGKRKYIKREHIAEAKLIAQRDYETEYLKCAEKEIKGLEKFINTNYPSNTNNSYLSNTEYCYSRLHPGRKCLVEPFELSDEEYIKRWMSIPYIGKKFDENDNTEYYTERGERVRSKSEVIIANTLNNMKIPYKYECPLKLDNTIIYPDFTILDVHEKCEKYLEHFGMMGDIDYVSNMMLKINTYERNGIYLGDKLICTFESLKRPINITVLQNKIKAILNPF